MIVLSLLVLLVSLELGIGLAVWLAPNNLRRMAARLIARAEALDAQRNAQAEALKYWSNRFKVEKASETVGLRLQEDER